MACAAKYHNINNYYAVFIILTIMLLLGVFSLWYSISSLLQGRCKSCYAFAVTGALESIKALENMKVLESKKVIGSEENKLIPLSEQNIIDCSGIIVLHKSLSKQLQCHVHYVVQTCIHYDCSSVWQQRVQWRLKRVLNHVCCRLWD